MLESPHEDVALACAVRHRLRHQRRGGDCCASGRAGAHLQSTRCTAVRSGGACRARCRTASSISSARTGGRPSACRCGWRSRPDRSTRPTTSRGSRTSSSTWRSTAARTSSPASWSRTSSRSARGSGRTSTPTPASTRRSTCSICRPTSPRSSRRGCTALADFAGGLTLDPEEVDKERGVVIEEWRGGLGAGSRIRDKQIPVLYYNSRYARAPADRQARDHPHRAGGAAAGVLRHLVSARAHGGRRRRRHRSAAARDGDRDAAFGRSRPRGAGRSRARTPTVPLHKELLVSVVTDPEVTQSSGADRPQAAAASEKRRSPTTAATWSQRLVEQMLNERFDEIWRESRTRSSSAPASAAARSSQDGRHVLDRRATCRTARSTTGSTAHRGRSQARARVRLRRRRARSRQASGWRAFYERAYNERDKTESGSFAQEYLNYFLEDEPSPGIAYEYQLVQQLLPGITAAEVVDAARKRLLGDDEPRRARRRRRRRPASACRPRPSCRRR